MTRFEVDAAFVQRSQLRYEKTSEEDLPLMRQIGFKDWNGKDLNLEQYVKVGRWVISEDRSVIFIGVGGGSFEIPEMYDLIYREERVRVCCGGGGLPAWIYPQGNAEPIRVLVTELIVPPNLSVLRESVVQIVVEALAVRALDRSSCRRLVVEFRK